MPCWLRTVPSRLSPREVAGHWTRCHTPGASVLGRRMLNSEEQSISGVLCVRGLPLWPVRELHCFGYLRKFIPSVTTESLEQNPFVRIWEWRTRMSKGMDLDRGFANFFLKDQIVNFFFFLSFGGQGAKIRILCIYLHSHLKYKHLKMRKPDIPGNPVIRLHASTAGGLGSIPSQGTKIPHPEWHSQ